MGARVLALDISNERLELAKYFGADELINSNEQDPISAIKDLTMAKVPTKLSKLLRTKCQESSCTNCSIMGHGLLCRRGEVT